MPFKITKLSCLCVKCRKIERMPKKVVSTLAVDTYTAEVLKESFIQHKNYVIGRNEIIAKTGLPIRLPNMPEDISENIVKFLIRRNGDKTSKWTKSVIQKKGQKITGDLVSEKEGNQECKCFTSVGPASFGPKEAWDVIYFLDATHWLDDRFVLWRIPLSNSSSEWKALKMNKVQSYDDQATQGRRPRMSWDSIKPQIEKFCQKIYEGTFEGIFIPAMEPTSPPAV